MAWSDALDNTGNASEVNLGSRTGWARRGGNSSPDEIELPANTAYARVEGSFTYGVFAATDAAAPSGTEDQRVSVEIQIPTTDGDAHCGAALRAQDAVESGYQVRMRGSSPIEILKSTAGSYVVVASSTQAHAYGSWHSLVADAVNNGSGGVDLSLTLNGGTPLTHTDSSSPYLSGRGGIGGYSNGLSATNSPRWRNFTVEEIGAGGGTPREIAATSSQPQTGSAALRVERPVAGTSSQPQTGAAALQVTRPIAGASSQPQTGASALQVTRPIAATSSQPQTGSASLRVGGVVEIAAESSQPQTSSAALRVERPVAAGSVQPQQGSAALQVGKVIAATGSMPQVGEVALLVVRPLAAESSQPQTGSGRVHIGEIIIAEGYLSGTIARGAALTGTISRGAALTGSVTRHPALSATITRRP